MTKMTIATRQRYETKARGPWIEAWVLDGPRGRDETRRGKMLQEEIDDETKTRTIAVRWVGEGIAIYRVVAVRDVARTSGNIWEVVALHEGL